MLEGSSIRFRLTAWYFLGLSAVLGIVATGSWFAMRASMYHAIDIELTHRLRGVRDFLSLHAGSTESELREELNRSSNLTLGGGLFQIFDERGGLLYQSPGLARHGITAIAPASTGTGIDYRNTGPMGWPVRLCYQRLEVGGRTFTIEVAEPLRNFNVSLRAFAWLLLFSVPALILLATSVGYLMSSRALAPVDRIIEEARAIDPNNLSERLSVPAARDELRRLSETLNAMLGRIESSVIRIRQFTADASHELRAPLALIQTAAEYTLRRERPREELIEAMQKVLRESKRTNALVDNLLLLARADSSNDSVRLAPTDLIAVLHEVADRTRELAAAKGLHFEADIGDTPAEVMGDATLLHRLFLILIDNAVKYTPQDGRVRLELRSTSECACVQVRDTGIGIAAEDVPRIFDRFWRADKVRSRSMGGTGLGLSIAKWIVDRSGGTITVESELGKGSKFQVTLPLSPTRNVAPRVDVLSERD